MSPRTHSLTVHKKGGTIVDTAPTAAPAKPDEFVVSGSSPPKASLPAHLVDELADLLAEAIIADLRQQPRVNDAA
jgi:hypothetical protein